MGRTRRKSCQEEGAAFAKARGGKCALRPLKGSGTAVVQANQSHRERGAWDERGDWGKEDLGDTCEGGLRVWPLEGFFLLK